MTSSLVHIALRLGWRVLLATGWSLPYRVALALWAGDDELRWLFISEWRDAYHARLARFACGA